MADVTAKLADVVRLMLDHFCNPAITRHDFKLRDQAREALAAYEQAQAEPKFDAEVHSADANLIGKHNALWVNYMALKDEVEQLRERLAAPVAQAAQAELEELVQAGWVLVEEAPAPEATPAPAPQGWKLVPVELTPEMLQEGNLARKYREHGDLRDEGVSSARSFNTRMAWAAMLAAAPEAATPAPSAEDQAAHDNAILEQGIQVGRTRERQLWEHRAATPAPAPQPCGHPASMMLKSAETGEPLYCEACDDKSGRRDAEQRESELMEANRALRAELAEARTALVATPAPAPLTREQVREIVREAGYHQGHHGGGIQARADFINGLRHGERAHGIGQGKEASNG